ncbi:Thiamine kinase @ Adenosylcobinamide kinase [Cronobacter condimenti 1330]|uniref:Thiamine kinase n=1 Tax=Cronobacter condimenti 1330 TaxID=1073999 RepID=K8A0G2_9ENTR|nr:thiamine kinase [Cronobacter condimenti]ALB62430.1 thiamine kinase [Cronobacter condimenti 1330]CCJ72240.1 Thiamine kinase @ Adenosylcobinamide kinase [Cronobacter condimenti 1330]
MQFSKPSNQSPEGFLTQSFPAASAAGVVCALPGLSEGAWRVFVDDEPLVVRRDTRKSRARSPRQYRALKRLPTTLAPRPRRCTNGWLAVSFLPGDIHDVLPPVPQLSMLLYHLHRQRCFGWRIALVPLLMRDWQQCAPSRRTPFWLRLLHQLRRSGEPRPLRLSPLHMDVHPGNLVWQQGQPMLIDWEYAGDGDVALELACVWLDEPTRQRLIADYAQKSHIDESSLRRQVARWRPWSGLLMAGWYERRFQETGDRTFMTLADEAWCQLQQCEHEGRETWVR